MPTAFARALLAFVVALPSVALADRLFLANGDEMEGIIVAESKDAITFKAEGIAWTIAREKITRFEKDAATARGEKEWEAKRKARLEAAAKQRSARATARRQAPAVTMYTTAWCGVCKRARAWLTDNEIPFVEKDIERSARAREEYSALQRAGRVRNGVPVIVIGRELIEGFSADWVMKALAARKR